MTSESAIIFIEHTKNETVEKSHISLPLELRDEIYDHVLADAGTLFLILPSSNGYGFSARSNTSKKDQPEDDGCHESDEQQNEHTTSSVLVDLKFQQRLYSLPLLAVSKPTRREFLARMAHHTRTVFSTVMHLPSGRYPPFVDTEMRIPPPLSALQPNRDFTAWLGFSHLSNAAICKLLRWQDQKGLVVGGMIFSHVGHATQAVSWTVSVPGEDPLQDPPSRRHAADIPTMRLHFNSGDRPINSCSMLIHDLEHGTRITEVYYSQTPRENDSSFDMILCASNRRGQILETRIIENSLGSPMERMKTPVDVISWRMQTDFSEPHDESPAVANIESRSTEDIEAYFNAWTRMVYKRYRK